MPKGVIKGVLKEELQNSLRMQKNYERELRRLPQGSLVKKIINGRPYYYLEIRHGRKIKFLYRGKVSKEELQKHNKAKHLRAKYRNILSQIRKQIRFLRSALRGKEPV